MRRSIADSRNGSRIWHFVERECCLVSGSGAATVTPKAATVLACLLRRKGEVVTREEMLAEVWQGLHVTPDLVREYVHDLRTILGDDARKPIYIETVKGRGFRLIGQVHFASRDSDAIGTGDLRATIAALKPDDYSLDGRGQRFAEGLVDDIITDLARYPDIAVIARHSSFAIDKKQDVRAVAETLGANYLLESSVSVVDDRFRAQFQLIDGRTGRHTWAKRFEKRGDVLPELIEDVAGSVANALGGVKGEIHRAERSLVRRKHPTSLNAYEHYLLACEYEESPSEKNLQLALHHIEQAIALDDTFARSWLILEWVASFIADYIPARDRGAWLRRVTEATEKAYALDPRDPLILVQIARQRALKGNQSGAIDALARAADLGANQADAAAFVAGYSMLFGSGNVEEAEELLQRAFQLNPTPPAWYALAECRVAYFSGDYERAERVTLSMGRYLSALMFLTLSQAHLGKLREAMASYQSLKTEFTEFDFHEYAAEFPIKNRTSVKRYREGIERLIGSKEALREEPIEVTG